MIRALLIAIALFLKPIPPKIAAQVAERFYPAVPKGFLEKVCYHESRCKAISVHKGDEKVSERNWRAASKVNWIQPEKCPEHRTSVGAGTRGAFGLVAVYHLRYLPEIKCAPYWVLDVPVVSAIIAARKSERFCRSEPSNCTPESLRVLWAGKHKKREDVIRRWRRK